MKQVGLIILALIVWVTPSSVFAAAADQVLFDLIGPDSAATDYNDVISTCNNLDAAPASTYTTIISYATPVDKDVLLTKFEGIFSDLTQTGEPPHYDQGTYFLRIWADPIDAINNIDNGTIANCELVYGEHITEQTFFGWRLFIPGLHIITQRLIMDLKHCNITIPKNSDVVIGMHAEIHGDVHGQVLYLKSDINHTLPTFIADHPAGTISTTPDAVGARLRGRYLLKPCGSRSTGLSCP